MNWWTKTVEFLSEVRTEMRKVSFPARDEVVSTTIVVVVTSVVFAAFLFVADRLIIWGYQGIVRMFG
jgi:preprotein translocase subunit SecE